jgi:hypothetical protein
MKKVGNAFWYTVQTLGGIRETDRAWRCFANQSIRAYVRYFHTEWSASVGITGNVHGNAIFCPPALNLTVQHSSLISLQVISIVFFSKFSPLHSDNHINGQVNRPRENTEILEHFVSYSWLPANEFTLLYLYNVILPIRACTIQKSEPTIFCDGLWSRRPEFNSRKGQEIFLFFIASRSALDPI